MTAATCTGRSPRSTDPVARSRPARVASRARDGDARRGGGRGDGALRRPRAAPRRAGGGRRVPAAGGRADAGPCRARRARARRGPGEARRRRRRVRVRPPRPPPSSAPVDALQRARLERLRRADRVHQPPRARRAAAAARGGPAARSAGRRDGPRDLPRGDRGGDVRRAPRHRPGRARGGRGRARVDPGAAPGAADVLLDALVTRFTEGYAARSRRSRRRCAHSPNPTAAERTGAGCGWPAGSRRISGTTSSGTRSRPAACASRVTPARSTCSRTRSTTSPRSTSIPGPSPPPRRRSTRSMRSRRRPGSRRSSTRPACWPRRAAIRRGCRRSPTSRCRVRSRVARARRSAGSLLVHRVAAQRPRPLRRGARGRAAGLRARGRRDVRLGPGRADRGRRPQRAAGRGRRRARAPERTHASERHRMGARDRGALPRAA